MSPKVRLQLRYNTYLEYEGLHQCRSQHALD